MSDSDCIPIDRRGSEVVYAVAVNALVLILILFCSTFAALSQDRPVTGSGPQSQPSGQELDQPSPVDIAPEPTDPTERAIRIIRNRLHNDTLPARSSNCTPGATNRAKNDGCVVL